MTVLSATILLLLVLDPLGNIPLLFLRSARSPKKRVRIILRESLIALFVLIFFSSSGSGYLRRFISMNPHLESQAGSYYF